MLNKVMLIGNVGADPEVHFINSGAPTQGTPAPKVASFRLATTERRRNRTTGETVENTEWHNIVAWRSLAELCENYIRKGSKLYVEGSLRSRSWDGQDGAKHYVTEILADTIQLLDRRNDNAAAPGAFGQGGYAPRQNSSQQGGYAPSGQGGYSAAPQQSDAGAAQQGHAQQGGYVPQTTAGFTPAGTAAGPIDMEEGSDDLPF